MEALSYRTKNTFAPNFTKSPPTQSEKLIRIRAKELPGDP